MKFSSINLYLAATPKSLSTKRQMSLKRHQLQQPEKIGPLYLRPYFFNPVNLSPMFNFQFTGSVIGGKRFNIDWTVEHSKRVSPGRLLSWLPSGPSGACSYGGDWGGKKKPHCRQHPSHCVPALQ